MRKPPSMWYYLCLIGAAVLGIGATLLKNRKDQMASEERERAAKTNSELAIETYKNEAENLKNQLTMARQKNEEMALAISDQIAATKAVQVVWDRAKASGNLPAPLQQELSKSENTFKSVQERLSKAIYEIPVERAAEAQKKIVEGEAEQADRLFAVALEDSLRERIQSAVNAIRITFEDSNTKVLFPEIKVFLGKLPPRTVLSGGQIKEVGDLGRAQDRAKLVEASLGNDVFIRVFSTVGVVRNSTAKTTNYSDVFLHVDTFIRGNEVEELRCGFQIDLKTLQTRGIGRGMQTYELSKKIDALAKKYDGDELIANVISEILKTVRLKL